MANPTPRLSNRLAAHRTGQPCADATCARCYGPATGRPWLANARDKASDPVNPSPAHSQAVAAVERLYAALYAPLTLATLDQARHDLWLLDRLLTDLAGVAPALPPGYKVRVQGATL